LFPIQFVPIQFVPIQIVPIQFVPIQFVHEPLKAVITNRNIYFAQKYIKIITISGSKASAEKSRASFLSTVYVICLYIEVYIAQQGLISSTN
jgi:hypothetical protein